MLVIAFFYKICTELKSENYDSILDNDGLKIWKETIPFDQIRSYEVVIKSKSLINRLAGPGFGIRDYYLIFYLVNGDEVLTIVSIEGRKSEVILKEAEEFLEIYSIPRVYNTAKGDT